MSNASAGYHPRKYNASPLWQLLNDHYDNFEQGYEGRFEKEYGFFRPIIGEVVREYLSCGDLRNGFARVKCKDCTCWHSLVKAAGSARHVMPKRLSGSENLCGIISSTQSPIGSMSSVSRFYYVCTSSMTGSSLQSCAAWLMKVYSSF